MLSIIFSRNIKNFNKLNKKYLSDKIFEKCLPCNNLKECINNKKCKIVEDDINTNNMVQLGYDFGYGIIPFNNSINLINITNNYNIKKFDYNYNIKKLDYNINEDNIRYYEDIYEED